MNSEENPETVETGPAVQPPPGQGEQHPQVQYAAAATGRKPSSFKQGFGLGTGLGLGLLVTAVVMSIIGGIISVLSLGVLAGMVSSSDASTNTEVIWGNEKAESKLHAIEISGPIMTSAAEGALFSEGVYGYEVADLLDEMTNEDADGVVLLVDTPGGSITGSKAISDAVERYQERTDNKVFVHVEGMSASGGVYATAPADAIYADHGSLIGSVGVIYGPIEHYEDVVATSGTLFEQGVTTEGGITQDYITRGEGKDFGQPFREMTDFERKMFDDMIDPEYDRFVEHVAANRDIDAKELVDKIGAAVFEPGRAEELGFTDGTMGRDEFFRKAAEEAGLDPDDTAVEAMTGPSAFESLFGVERTLGKSLPIPVSEASNGKLSTTLCGGAKPMVFVGDPATVCS